MSEEIKFTFDLKFQTKLLKLMIDDPVVLIKSVMYVKPHYFETKWLEWCFKKTVEYYNTYQKVATEIVLVSEVSKLDPVKENLLEYLSVVKQVFAENVNEPEYIIDRLEEFIKRNIFIGKMKDVVVLYNNNKFDEAVKKTEECWNQVSQINFENSDRTFFFRDVNDRMLKRDSKLEKNNVKFTTGVFELDEKIYGGLEKGELGIVVADAKVGKSIFLINKGAAAALSRTAKVAHFNLEGKDGQVEDRYEARILNKDYNDIKYNRIVASDYKFYNQLNDNLMICNMTKSWNYTVLDIENELKELRTHNFVPDTVIIDYGDLLSPRLASRDNSYQAQQEVFRDLKTLASRYNVEVWTASQVARPPLGSNPQTDPNFFWSRRNLADCYAKVRIADLLITLNVTDQEKMENKMRIYVDAYRDSECGQKIYINTNYKNMQFYVPGPISYQR